MVLTIKQIHCLLEPAGQLQQNFSIHIPHYPSSLQLSRKSLPLLVLTLLCHGNIELSALSASNQLMSFLVRLGTLGHWVAPPSPHQWIASEGLPHCYTTATVTFRVCTTVPWLFISKCRAHTPMVL